MGTKSGDNEQNIKGQQHLVTIITAVVMALGLAILLSTSIPNREVLSNTVINKRLEMNVGDAVNILEEFDSSIDPSTISYKVSDENVVSIDRGTGQIEAKADGKVIVTIKSTEKKFEKNVEISVTTQEAWTKFDKENYSCKVGESFDVMISTGGNGVPILEGYWSNNKDIATIETGSLAGDQLNCVDCALAHVTCIKEGIATLEAKGANGSSAKATVKVRSNDTSDAWTKFDKESYSCSVGDTFDVLVKTGGSGDPFLEGYYSNDNEIATISSGTMSGNEIDCIDCAFAHVKCLKEGTTTLEATSANGSSAKVTLTVKEKKAVVVFNNGWIKFDKDGYTCEVGKTIDVIIKTGGLDTPSTIKTYASKDPSIATLEYGTTNNAALECVDCMAAHITCKRVGTTSVTATSSSGATTSSSVIVKEKK